MSLLNRTVLLALLLGCPAERALAGGPGCAPAGTQVPHLSLRGAQGVPSLRLENGPAGGRALFLARLPFVSAGGFARPGMNGCAAEARGTLVAQGHLDAAGALEIPLSPGTVRARPTLSALVLPPGVPLSQAVLSNTITLGPMHDRAPDQPGAGAGGGGDGVVVITEFMKDPAAVGDSAGEWIELYNPGASPVDIEGWVLSDLGSDSLALLNGGQGIVVPAGGFFVLGKNDDMAANGGVAIDFVLSGTTLSNGDDEIILSRADGRVVDEVHYDGGTLWPDDAGRSASLQVSAFDVTANDDPGNWCNSSSPVSPGSTDTGTPGLTNDACSGG